MNSGKTVATEPTGFLVPNRMEQRKGRSETRNSVCGVNRKPLLSAERGHATRFPFRFPFPGAALGTAIVRGRKPRRGPVHARGRPARKPLIAIPLHPDRQRAAKSARRRFQLAPSYLHDALVHCLMDRSHRRLKAKASSKRGVNVLVPWVPHRFR